MAEPISITDVKEIMERKCGGGGDRDLVIIPVSRGPVRDVVIYLEGLPPKGWAITGNGQISFYDVDGRRYKILRDTYIDGVN